MDFQKLKTELRADPLARGYANMTDAEAAASLNTPDRPMVVETYANAKTLLSHLGATPGAAVLDALETIAVSNSAVKWALKFITSPEGIDVGNLETRAMLDQLVAATVLSAADVATIKMLAERQISRAEELGLGLVREGDVQTVRAI